MTKVDSILKSRHYSANKGPSSQSYCFSSSHVWVWELDSKQSWVPKNWCFWTVMFEKTLESHLDYKEIQPVHPKGNQLWIFIGRTDAEPETLILWPPDARKWPQCWERLKAEGEGDDRGWSGWMASPTQWTWVWLNSGYLTSTWIWPPIQAFSLFQTFTLLHNSPSRPLICLNLRQESPPLCTLS